MAPGGKERDFLGCHTRLGEADVGVVHVCAQVYLLS